MKQITSPGPDRLWTIHDVSSYLQVHMRTVRRWLSGGKFPPGRRVGRQLRWQEHEIISWYHEQSSKQ